MLSIKKNDAIPSFEAIKAEAINVSNGTSLFLVQFSNANIRWRTRLGLKLPQFHPYKKSEVTAFKSKRILIASTKELKYAGSNYKSEISEVVSSVRLKVCLISKIHKMKLYDVDFFHLMPVMTSLKVAEVEKSWNTKCDDLTLEFGSKIRKQAINSRLKYEAASHKSVESIIAPEVIQSQLQKTNCFAVCLITEIIPPQNKTALNVGEIYRLFDIISEQEYHALDTEANIFLNADYGKFQSWKKSKKFCIFIIFCLESNFQDISLHKAKMICYLNYMLCLLKKTYKDLQRKDPVPEVPQPFKKKLLEKYTENKCFPQRQKDKLVSYAMVLSLIINNYCIDCQLWAASTQIPVKRLVLIAYTLGCYVSDRKSQDIKMIELKLPLYKYEKRVQKK